MTGNLLGLVHGAGAIPAGWLEVLELQEVIEELGITAKPSHPCAAPDALGARSCGETPARPARIRSRRTRAHQGRSRARRLAMIDAPRIVQTTAQLTAVIHLKVPRARIQEVMGPGLAEIKAAVAAQGVAATGPWFTHHLRISPDTFDFEISVPEAAPVTAAGRVRPSVWPAMKVARTVYRGPYEGLAAAWGEFDAWVKANGHEPAPDLWECYLAGPESSPDPAAWRTQLSRRLGG
jgi:effector-binding domain-containing protein